jgi:TRAP-type C4-dicarboxylate transport system permease small subunit
MLCILLEKYFDDAGHGAMEMEKTGLERFCDALEKSTLHVTMVLGVIMLIVAWMHVTGRYVFNSALTWSEEFLRFAIVWYALLSASILHKRNGHLGITIIREAMPVSVQLLLKRVVIYLGTLTVALITIFGTVLVFQTYAQTTPALGVSMGLPYAAIPFSFLLMTIYGVAHVIRDARGLPPMGSGHSEHP